MIFDTHRGEMYALFAALLWVFGAMLFETLGKKNGATTVNFLRLLLGFIFLSIFTLFSRGFLLPIDADLHSWLWLLLSGIVGFAIGDLFLFKALVMIGARISMLIMTLAPPTAAILGWLILGETLSPFQLFGMVVTLFGIAIVILQRQDKNSNNTKKNGQKFKYPLIGILMAVIGALGQGTGLVLSKLGMRDYNPFAATQIRIIAGLFGLGIIISFSKKWKTVLKPVTNIRTMSLLSLGAVLGSFLGISFSLLAIKYTNTGVASTIMAIQPILLIPASMVIFKEKVNFTEVIGALVAVSGIVLFFM
ncbi:MAG: DMT family transporter [Chlorobi bacterium]|nr:DMT family transporter [Chlorobiota bacterium]